MTLARAIPLTFFVSALAALPAPAAEKTSGNAEHGRYLVHHVAMCVQCHSPRDQKGDLIPTQLLHGAPMPVASPFRDLSFAVQAPRIASLPGYTDEEGVRLLVKGLTRDGRPPRPPMPPFRMTPEDARDVVSYLKSAR